MNLYKIVYIIVDKNRNNNLIYYFNEYLIPRQCYTHPTLMLILSYINATLILHSNLRSSDTQPMLDFISIFSFDITTT